MRLKKMSDRGIATIVFIAAFIIGLTLINVIDRVQNQLSAQWQQEIGITIEKE